MIRDQTLNFISPTYLPDWTTRKAASTDLHEAVFLAGAALTTLDQIVRTSALWGGVWRQRLALQCAVNAVRLVGRRDDEAMLRDAWVLRKTSDDPGPSGNIYGAWKRLGQLKLELNEAFIRELTDLLGLRWSNDLAELPEQIDNLLHNGPVAPLAAAALVSQICQQRADAEVLAWWLADYLLAQKLGWKIPVPLMMAQRYSKGFQISGGRGRIGPEQPEFAAAFCSALLQAIIAACRQADDIARRAHHLQMVTPKLRAKGAGDALRLLLDEDAVSGTLQTPRLSRFASRRLFERLMQLNAVRELSGRSAFRIYGL